MLKALRENNWDVEATEIALHASGEEEDDEAGEDGLNFTQRQAQAIIQSVINNFLFDPQYKEIRDKIRADPENAATILASNQGNFGIDLNQLCNENPELLPQIVEEIQAGSQEGDEEISESELNNMLAGADRTI